jgi:hypothetical protein
MSDICDFIDQMASPALQSSSTLPVKYEHELIMRSGDITFPTIIIAYLMRKYGTKDVLAVV